MTRRDALRLGAGLPAILAGCRGNPGPAPDLFPLAVEGGWQRAAMPELAPSDAPDPVPRPSIERLLAADYTGPGKLQVRVYELSSNAVALDLAQRWRPSADTVFFNRGRYFVVVKWQEADRNALRAFVREIDRRVAAVRP